MLPALGAPALPGAPHEERAFNEAWRYIGANQPCVVYCERTIWRQLQAKYQSVCTADDIEDLFHPSQSVDL